MKLLALCRRLGSRPTTARLEPLLEKLLSSWGLPHRWGCRGVRRRVPAQGFPCRRRWEGLRQRVLRWETSPRRGSRGLRQVGLDLQLTQQLLRRWLELCLSGSLLRQSCPALGCWEANARLSGWRHQIGSQSFYRVITCRCSCYLRMLGGEPEVWSWLHCRVHVEQAFKCSPRPQLLWSQGICREYYCAFKSYSGISWLSLQSKAFEHLALLEHHRHPHRGTRVLDRRNTSKS